MGQLADHLSPRLIEFIEGQKIFFVATAAAEGSVNLSPKGMDALRILNPRRVAWLNVTGSGNETAAHVAANPRMTLMFTAFSGPPLILRLYGTARGIHSTDGDWATFAKLFPALPGARQVFDLKIDRVLSSCGMAVPQFDYQGEREALNQWAEKKGPEGIRQYWQDRNQTSLDGQPTRMAEVLAELDGGSA